MVTVYPGQVVAFLLGGFEELKREGREGWSATSEIQIHSRQSDSRVGFLCVVPGGRDHVQPHTSSPGFGPEDSDIHIPPPTSPAAPWAERSHGRVLPLPRPSLSRCVMGLQGAAITAG